MKRAQRGVRRWHTAAGGHQIEPAATAATARAAATALGEFNSCGSRKSRRLVGCRSLQRRLSARGDGSATGWPPLAMSQDGFANTHTAGHAAGRVRLPWTAQAKLVRRSILSKLSLWIHTIQLRLVPGPRRRTLEAPPGMIALHSPNEQPQSQGSAVPAPSDPFAVFFARMCGGAGLAVVKQYDAADLLEYAEQALVLEQKLATGCFLLQAVLLVEYFVRTTPCHPLQREARAQDFVRAFYAQRCGTSSSELSTRQQDLLSWRGKFAVQLHAALASPDFAKVQYSSIKEEKSAKEPSCFVSSFADHHAHCASSAFPVAIGTRAYVRVDAANAAPSVASRPFAFLHPVSVRCSHARGIRMLNSTTLVLTNRLSCAGGPVLQCLSMWSTNTWAMLL